MLDKKITDGELELYLEENHHVDFIIEEETAYTKEEIEQIKSILDEKINNLELEIDNLVETDDNDFINGEFMRQEENEDDSIIDKEKINELKSTLNDKINKLELELKNL